MNERPTCSRRAASSGNYGITVISEGSPGPPREAGDSGQPLLAPESTRHDEPLTTVHCLERLASN